jgi:D-alanyl-D-alanine dipeptidase
VNRHRSQLALFLTVSFLLAFCTTIRAQNAAISDAALLPSSKPPDVPLNWKQLVGIYGRGPTETTLLEHDGKLIWHSNSEELTLQSYDGSEFVVPQQKGPRLNVQVERNSDGNVKILVATPEGSGAGCNRSNCSQMIETLHFSRTDAGADPAHFYHIKLSKPLSQFRAAALAANPPTENSRFRKPDLVELTTLDRAIHLDIRYAQSNNFLSAPVYTEARAFMQRPAAEALLRALYKLQPLGYGLLIHDAYRPWYVTKIFWDATPLEDHIFVADPKKGSRHNRGCAVDLTLYDLATGQPVEMPGQYDEMSPRSFPTFPGGTSLQRWHRDLLRRAMELEGFTVNEEEWWHFDYKDWKVYPILNVPFEKVQTASPVGPF